MNFRQTIFWLHLLAGVVCGLVIAVMCVTGTALAFEKEIIAWAERDARRVERPTLDTPRLPAEELHARLRAARPDANPTTLVLHNDDNAAVVFTVSRTVAFYLNPYTGEVKQPRSTAVARFMQQMVEWHRYLGFGGQASRPRGKWINGACNVAFCLLAVTGLYLWLPRRWSWRAVRPIIWFNSDARGKARNFNWHNAVGFWSAPVLIVLTLTAMPISFRWAADALYRLTGTPLPAPGGAAAPTAGVQVSAPAGAPLLNTEALLRAGRETVRDWQTITVRIAPATSTPGTPAWESSAGEVTSAAATLTIRHKAAWPRTALTTLHLNPFNGQPVRLMGYADLNAAQKLRSWTRFLHTGEALGGLGQLIAGLACVGGALLVYTGLALTIVRLRN